MQARVRATRTVGKPHLVADLPPDRRRCESGDLGHELPRPLAFAQQKHPGVEALNIVGAKDALWVSPDDEVDAGRIVPAAKTPARGGGA